MSYSINAAVPSRQVRLLQLGVEAAAPLTSRTESCRVSHPQLADSAASTPMSSGRPANRPNATPRLSHGAAAQVCSTGCNGMMRGSRYVNEKRPGQRPGRIRYQQASQLIAWGVYLPFTSCRVCATNFRSPPPSQPIEMALSHTPRSQSLRSPAPLALAGVLRATTGGTPRTSLTQPTDPPQPQACASARSADQHDKPGPLNSARGNRGQQQLGASVSTAQPTVKAGMASSSRSLPPAIPK